MMVEFSPRKGCRPLYEGSASDDAALCARIHHMYPSCDGIYPVGPGLTTKSVQFPLNTNGSHSTNVSHAFHFKIFMKCLGQTADMHVTITPCIINRADAPRVLKKTWKVKVESDSDDLKYRICGFGGFARAIGYWRYLDRSIVNNMVVDGDMVRLKIEFTSNTKRRRRAINKNFFHLPLLMHRIKQNDRVGIPLGTLLRDSRRFGLLYEPDVYHTRVRIKFSSAMRPEAGGAFLVRANAHYYLLVFNKVSNTPNDDGSINSNGGVDAMVHMILYALQVSTDKSGSIGFGGKCLKLNKYRTQRQRNNANSSVLMEKLFPA